MTDTKNNVLGFGFQMCAICMFLLLDVCIKILVADYPLMEMLFYRSIMGLPFLLVYLKITHNLHTLRINRPWMHVLMGIVGFFSLYCFFNAYKYLTLAEAAALLYTAPIMITVLGVVILKERMYAHRMCALILGFVGTLVVVRPSMDFNWFYLYAILGAFTVALITIIGYNLTKTDHSIAITVSSSVIVTLISGVITLHKGFSPIDNMWFVVYVIVMGISGTMAHILNMQAIKYCHASFFAVTKYMGLFGATAISILAFHEALSWNVGLGMVIIVVSGVYMVWREHVKKLPS